MNKMSIYPNPATAEITISTKKPMRSVKIFDGLGRTVYSEKSSNNSEWKCDVSILKKGAYTIVAEVNDELCAERFIVSE